MNKTTETVLIKVLFIAILAVALWFVLQWVQTGVSKETDAPGQSAVVEDDGSFAPDVIVAIHTYENGLHEVKGKISLPTPCHELQTSVVVAESFPEQVTLDFNISDIPEGTACIQVIAEKEFSLTFEASENPIIGAKVNGKRVMLVTDDQSGTLQPITP